MKKIKAKVAYRDDTLREIMSVYNLEHKVYVDYIADDNEDMVHHMYKRLCAVLDYLHLSGAISTERWKYMCKELRAERGWVF